MSKVGSIDPEGILNAWTTKVLMKSAKRTAMQIASKYSRKTDLFLPSFFKLHLFHLLDPEIKKISGENYLKYTSITSEFDFDIGIFHENGK